MRTPNSVQVSPDTFEKMGRALADNNDWRAMLLVAAVIILALIAERGIAAWGIRQERKLMADERKAQNEATQLERDRVNAVAEKLAESMEKVGTSLTSVSVELGVLRAVSSRVESDAGRRT